MSMRQLSLMPAPETLRPIDADQQRLVLAHTQDCLARAAVLYQRDFPSVTVLFDLRGQAAGQFRWTARSRQCVIRYNPWVFAADFTHHLKDTVVHEVAHYLVYHLHGTRAKAHGLEWRRVMKAFGVAPKATGHYDLSGVPVRAA
jgi:SprT protein